MVLVTCQFENQSILEMIKTKFREIPFSFTKGWKKELYSKLQRFVANENLNLQDHDGFGRKKKKKTLFQRLENFTSILTFQFVVETSSLFLTRPSGLFYDFFSHEALKYQYNFLSIFYQ